MQEIKKNSMANYANFWLAQDYNADQAERMLRKVGRVDYLNEELLDCLFFPLQSLEWRKIHKADALLDIWSPPPVLLNYFSFRLYYEDFHISVSSNELITRHNITHHSHIGYDKFGCPIMFTAQGRTDMKAVLQCVTRRDYFRYMIWTLEKAKRQMFLDKKRNCLKITILADVQDLSIMRLTNKTGCAFH